MIKGLLPFFTTIVARTLRYEWKTERPKAPCVVMFWHGKMFAGWYVTRKLHPVALVSKSKDGELLTSVLSHWRYKLVRGSSKKHGREALEEAMDLVRQHRAGAIAITPDGPRGPRHRYKRGAFIAAQALNVPLYHVGIEYSSAKILTKSWDKFEIPAPFTTVTLQCERIDCAGYPVDPDEQRAWLDALAARIEGNAP